MSTYLFDEFLRQWAQGSLTPEQAIGHLLQHVRLQHERLSTLEGRFTALAAEVADRVVGPPQPAPVTRKKRR